MTGASKALALRIVTLPLDDGVSRMALIAPMVVTFAAPLGNPTGTFSISGQSAGNCESRVTVRVEKLARYCGGSFSNER